MAEFEGGNVYRAQRSLNAYCLAFFDPHLMGLAAPLLDGATKKEAEVEMRTPA